MKSVLVECAEGTLQGFDAGAVNVFKGVSYAAPPIGTLRFLPPQPLKAWKGVREALDFGPMAQQADILEERSTFDWLNSSVAKSEDCLNLNIYAPANSPPGGVPVMVYFHGGAFAFGSASAPVLDGVNLARDGKVVLVTVTHRLNVFGFLAMPEASEEFAQSGNLGMLDLVAALKWLQANIHAFGGDNANITIMGQSGGAGKVAMLMSMPSAEGLFHKAVLQSPATSFIAQDLVSALTGTSRLLKLLGINANDGKALRSVPAIVLLKAMAETVKLGGGFDSFRPVVDGTVLFGDAFGLKIFSKVPTLFGYNDTETSFYLEKQIAQGTIGVDSAIRRISSFLGISTQDAQGLFKTYLQDHPKMIAGEVLSQISGDQLFKMQTIDAAERALNAGLVDAYFYKFNIRARANRPYLGAPHTGELPFVFGNISSTLIYTDDSPANRELSTVMMDAWCNFARTGKPASAELPEWLPYELGARRTMVLDIKSSLVADPDAVDRLKLAPMQRYFPGSPFTFLRDE